MNATKLDLINNSSKVASAIAFALLISACGQGFKSQQNSQVINADSDESLTQSSAYVFDDIEESVANAIRQPASEPDKTLPVAANDNEPINVKFMSLSPAAEDRIMNRYKHIDPQHQIDKQLLKKALTFFFVNQGSFPNRSVITVVDYSLPSSEKRLYVIEMKTGRVWSTYVAHGSGSDRNHDGIAEGFSNKINSNATSLGPFMALQPYRGQHGPSLRLKGLAKSNSNAYTRNVVVHGAPYVKEASTKQGRSWGCIAVVPKYTMKFISTIKGGSLVYSGLSNPSAAKEI